MDKDNIFSLKNSGCFEDSLTELLRSSAQQMLAQAIEAERDEFLTALPRPAQCNGIAGGGEKRLSPEPPWFRPASDRLRCGCRRCARTRLSR